MRSQIHHTDTREILTDMGSRALVLRTTRASTRHQNQQAEKSASQLLFNLSLVDLLLALSTVLAPMTSLRIWKVGPAEALCLLGCLIHVISNRGLIGVNRRLCSFWGCFLFATVLGTAYGCLLYTSETIPAQLLTWAFFAVVSILSYDAFSTLHPMQLRSTLRGISLLGCVWYSILYAYSKLISPVFMGASLWFEGTRFAGGGSNPHHLALLLCIASVILFSSMLL